MRIIPKNTRVAIEFFKGIDLIDILVGMLGVTLEVFIYTSNFGLKFPLMIAVLLITVLLLLRMDADKVYVLAYHLLKHLSYRKVYRKYSPMERALNDKKKKKGEGKRKRNPLKLRNKRSDTDEQKTDMFSEPEIEKAEEAAYGIRSKGESITEEAEYTGAETMDMETIEAEAPKPEAADMDTTDMNTVAADIKKGKKARKPKPEKKSRKEWKADKKPRGEKLEKASKEFDVYDIMPFTGISDGLIEYGGKYYAAVLEIPSIDFRFFSAHRQDNMIDKVLGSILRSIPLECSANIVKIDRYINMDKYVIGEEKKMSGIRESYLNGLISEEELTTRMQILLDRREDLMWLNYEERIVKSFHYLVLFDPNPESARSRAISAFETLYQSDMQSFILNDMELAIFLKYNFTLDFDEHEAYEMNPADYMDWIMPERVEFKARKVLVDEMTTYNMRVYQYPTEVGNAWGCNMFNMPNTKVVMKMKPLDRYKAIQRIDRAIDELSGQGGSTSKISRLMEVDKHIETLAQVMRLLQGDNETLFETNIYLTLYEREEGLERNEFKRRVRRSLAEESFKIEEMLLKQFEAYVGGSVSAFDPCLRQSRSIHSSSVAAAFPFVLSALDDEEGINLGYSDGIPAFVNFFKRDDKRVNSNMVIIGKSGSGKSYATKMMLSNLSAEDSKVFILDPENEYSGIAKKMNGKLIDAGSAKQGRINPFHIVPTVDEEGEDGAASSFVAHLQFLEEFFRQILPDINSDALEQLNNILVMLYEMRGIDDTTDITRLTPGDFPTFDDVYDKILNDFQMSTGDYSKNNLRTLMNYISKFATGGRNSALWNGESTISTNENFVVFNFQSLLANKNNTIANAQMLLILKWLDNEIIKNRDYNIKYKASRKVIIVIDEAHVFIDEKHPVALDFMFQLAKRIRKYNGMQIIITQNVKDFVGSEEIARKSTAIINACQYSFIFSLSPNDMHDLCRLYEKAGEINPQEQEQIINNPRGTAFVVTSPTSRTGIHIVASPEVAELF